MHHPTNINRKKGGFIMLLLFIVVTSLAGAIFVARYLGNTPPASFTPPPPADAAYRDSTLPNDERLENLLSYMTLDEKIGQMALVEKNSLSDSNDVSTYGIGGVLSGAGGKPKDNAPEGWLDMVAQFTDAAQATRLSIPLLYGADANHGNGNVPSATLFPHFIGLGAANDPALTERVARTTALESSAIGIRWHYSPTLDLPKDIRWGRVYEAFSDDPARVGPLAAAYVRGLQHATGAAGPDIAVLATPKHFVGLGSMTWGTSRNADFKIDQGVIPSDDAAAMRDIYLPPFRAALDAGALSVMAGLASWSNEDIARNSYLLTDVLKDELGFTGFVVSDWYGVHENAVGRYEATVLGITAGVDMVMLPYDYKSFVSDMQRAVANGDVTEARIDDAVRRILRAKFAMGLFDEPATPPLDLSIIGSPEHRELAREAVQQSLVLLKNATQVLPLSPETQHIRIAGSAADNVGMQTGGWTVEWQGIDGNWLPEATSILAGIRASVSSETNIDYDLLGNFPDGTLADVGIAIVGEKPYAEGAGDNAQPRLSDTDIAAIANLRETSRTVVVVIVGGRPLIVTDDISRWDAAIAAWLPGSEGQGVADMLFGIAPFTGTLPLPWPRSTEQLPMTLGGQTSDGSAVLFPRGFGLRE